MGTSNRPGGDRIVVGQIWIGCVCATGADVRASRTMELLSVQAVVRVKRLASGRAANVRPASPDGVKEAWVWVRVARTGLDRTGQDEPMDRAEQGQECGQPWLVNRWSWRQE